MKPEQPDLFAPPGAKLAKEMGMSRVTENAANWLPKALVAIADLADARRGHEVTGEDIRILVLRTVGPPHHHNIWGSVIRMSIERDWLVPTGRWTAMKTTRSHARRTPIYRLA